MKTLIFTFVLLGTPAYGETEMKENLTEGLEIILEHEGLYSDDPKDSGGATMRGVTQKVYESYVDRPVSKDEMKTLSVADVTPIYEKEYWARVKGDDLPAGLDIQVMDMSINSGVSRAAKLLQKVVGVKQDGGIGPQTLAAVSKMDPVDIIENYAAQRAAFYKRLNQPRFEKGWLRRNEKTKIEALKLAEG